jgi:hypothetical protein
MVLNHRGKMSKVHVVPHDGEWAVKTENNAGYISHHNTQEAAINAAKPLAQLQHTELVIHRPNGQIREAWSYGNDPSQSLG